MAYDVVEIDHVSKSFDNLQAVDDVSLNVSAGQTLGLIGPNGAGKTTLLRMICTLAKPDSGDVRILGESVSRQSAAARKRIGFMPAEFGSPRNLSIGEYLDYFGSLHGIALSERTSRIREVCELTDLTGREHIMVKGLSTGNRQRLLLAKTLLHDPDVLILDEPASGLDPRARNELRAIVKTLASLGKTIIISSHILPDIEEISDQIAILEAGRLVLDGNLEALRSQTGTSERIVRLRIPSDQRQAAQTLLNDHSDVISCEVRDQFLIVATNAEDSNVLLSTLIENSIHISLYSEEETNLEDIFMNSTAGKVT